MDIYSVSAEELVQSLRNFIDGKDRSMAAAGWIEVALDEKFPDDEEMADVVLALASYRPGGGEYLYDEHQLVKFCELALAKVLKQPASG